ncbi:DUF968 domain-containing protein [Orbus wheelerorum]|uniref:DUF968 domain-containing protein n=1 Tax=Orbus wheelerorum TaxID=3074111 RepID=UPI00370D883B
MKALLTPYYQPELGLIILKPGAELLKKIGTSSRIIIEPSTEKHNGIKSGILNEEQPLLKNKHIDPFLFNDKIIDIIKNKGFVFDWWLERKYKCQLEDGDYCYHESTNETVSNSAIRICYHHNKDLVIDENIKSIAQRNLKMFLLESISQDLKLGASHKLSIFELGWWAVINRQHDLIPENMARLLYNREMEKHQSVYKESETIASDDRSYITLNQQANETMQYLQEVAKPIKKITVDINSPESFMLRPKLKRWECEKYTQWVKTQPCVCCGKQADDPHHIIGYGQGKMGGKPHDIFTIPLCRTHHNDLHHNVVEWEQRHGSQILLLINFLDCVFGMQVII